MWRFPDVPIILFFSLFFLPYPCAPNPDQRSVTPPDPQLKIREHETRIGEIDGLIGGELYNEAPVIEECRYLQFCGLSPPPQHPTPGVLKCLVLIALHPDGKFPRNGYQRPTAQVPMTSVLCTPSGQSVKSIADYCSGGARDTLRRS